MDKITLVCPRECRHGDMLLKPGDEIEVNIKAAPAYVKNGWKPLIDRPEEVQVRREMRKPKGKSKVKKPKKDMEAKDK